MHFEAFQPTVRRSYNQRAMVTVNNDKHKNKQEKKANFSQN